MISREAQPSAGGADGTGRDLSNGLTLVQAVRVGQVSPVEGRWPALGCATRPTVFPSEFPMTRFRWPLLVFGICLAVGLLAIGVPLPFIDRPVVAAKPRPVPSGDQELAWLHTTTNGSTWERFVVGMRQAQKLVPGLVVDDSAAFADRTTAVPEVVVSMAGREGKLRVRWYKLSNETTTEYWVKALADRDPAPLALVGGGSTDRAVDLARALEAQPTWRGERPLLLITTATADEVVSPFEGDASRLTERTNLVDVYKGRTFRFCFTNRQMANSVLDFVWGTPALRPESYSATARVAVASGLSAKPPAEVADDERPHVFTVFWRDDPYSTDLYLQFGEALSRKLSPPGADPMHAADGPYAHFSTWSVNYSVGGFTRPNMSEARVVENLLQELQKLPPQRSLLVLPTVTQPGRRFLRTLAESAPQLASRLVAVTGDGIPVNAIYRDGEFAWPVHAMPVPLVLFTHNNPVGWDGVELRPPTSTEDVLHFAELTRVVAEAAYAGPNGPVASPSDLGAKLKLRSPAFFDDHGNRLDGTGEYVVVLSPQGLNGHAGPRIFQTAKMEVYRRRADRSWDHVRTVDIDQRRVRPEGRRE